MGRVTALEPQKKKKDRVSVFIDEQFAFGLSVELSYLNKLKVGKELTDKEVQQLIGKDQTERLFNKSLRFLGFRPRSEKETRDYLRYRGKLKDLETEEEKQSYLTSIEEAIAKLRKLKFLNDSEFATWWAKQREEARGTSGRILKSELMLKGIDKEIINDVLALGEPEESKAKKVADKKAKILKNLTKEEFRIKLGQYLARAGFNWDTIKKIVDSYRQNG